MSVFAEIDLSLLNWLNHHYVPGSLPFLQFISSATTYVSIALVVMVMVFSFVKNKPLARRCSIALATVLMVVAIASPVMKSLMYRERPFYAHDFIEKRTDGGESSFPSGHSMEAFALAITLSLCFKRKWITLVAFAWAFLVGYSRVALGVHYPSDVLGGMALGSFIGWSTLFLFHRFGPYFTDDKGTGHP